ncbi:MAG: PAS domain S-box protein [Syntrophobacteraceae bacterium]|nr:PAS domain S-box protein [Syntrophobacteraceae bacterium]
MADAPEVKGLRHRLGSVPVETGKILAQVFRWVEKGLPTSELLRLAVSLLADYTGFDAVGLRLREGDDYPYCQTRGMSQEFVRLENSLCPRRHGARPEPGEQIDDAFLECVCGAVIQGRVDRSLSFISEYGSFWSNSNTLILNEHPELKDSIRGNCVRTGYESSALIPLKLGEETFGLLQFEDKRPGGIPRELLSILESIAVSLALVLSQRQHLRRLTEDKVLLETRVLEKIGELSESHEILCREKKRKEWAEAEARDSEARFRALFDHIPDGGLVVDVEKKEVLFGNEKMCRMLGYRPEELSGLKMMDIHPESAKPFVSEGLENLSRGESLLTSAVPVLRRDGSIFPADISGSHFEMAGRSCAVGLFRDISERERAESALRQSEERFRLLVKLAPVPMCLIGRNGVIDLLNDRFSEILGYTLDDVPTIGDWWRLAYPDKSYRDQVSRGWETALEQAAKEGGYVEPAEFNVRGKDGGTRVMQTSAILVGDSVLVSLVDLTDQKQVEVALRYSLEEKIALLGEIHHRVKNNLQIIASLLGLQAGRLDNQEVIDALEDTRNRVKSMALLHETLYRSQNLARINFAAYIKDLCAQVLISHGPVSERVVLGYRIAAIGLPLEQAVPCGLIINELVSNALKHGFPGSRKGSVRVTLECKGEESLVLEVSDEGVGLPADFDPVSGSTMGIQIVTGLAAQLGGRLEVDGSGPGASFRVFFPVPRGLSIRGKI